MAKRMAKEARRRQLLETALEIVRSEGTEALTLSYLAERAGVTKPIAYEHFGSRSGLLIALYRDYDERQAQAMRAALEANGRTLEDVVGIVSAAYVDCLLTAGPEFGAIAAALSATEEMEDFLQSLRDSYIAELRKAFAPFTKLPRGEGQALLTGLLGASDSLSQAAASGRLSRAQAVSALSHIMLGALRSSAG
ncbi:TetR/AcrR family transcriptional regulator [Archangium lipolyticum]|uniref:TetR/AcrR family transcriptional regulator n=1 Tax=Archangium lipolyticum TaxID=2970465 RepID=UPI00214A3075|nr:TetR/AcrR family transcriptional regulator [Archangium lipolyticum]